MTKFRCEACGYSLERNTKPKTCPYCGKNNSMAEEKNAEQILKLTEP